MTEPVVRAARLAEARERIRELEEQLEAAQAQAGSLDGLYEQAKLRAQRAEEQFETVDRALGRMEWQIKRVLPEGRIDTFLSTLLGDIVQLRSHISNPASEPKEGA